MVWALKMRGEVSRGKTRRNYYQTGAMVVEAAGVCSPDPALAIVRQSLHTEARMRGLGACIGTDSSGLLRDSAHAAAEHRFLRPRVAASKMNAKRKSETPSVFFVVPLRSDLVAQALATNQPLFCCNPGPGGSPRASMFHTDLQPRQCFRP